MEQINDFIHLNIQHNKSIDASFCTVTQDETYLFASYRLFVKDCLFYLGDSNYEFSIRIAKSYFQKYNEGFDIHIQEQSICCHTQNKLFEIVNCKLTGLVRKIFLESQILYLLYQTQKNSLVFGLQCNRCEVLDKPIDLHKMHEARKYILEHLSDNITIPLIAAHVATNQCYLKKGFKEVFQQTVFEFLQENRMIKAQHLLRQANPNITQVAFEVGYSSLSSFSQAYKNYFGISPVEQSKVDVLYP